MADAATEEDQTRDQDGESEHQRERTNPSEDEGCEEHHGEGHDENRHATSTVQASVPHIAAGGVPLSGRGLATIAAQRVSRTPLSSSKAIEATAVRWHHDCSGLGL